MKFRPLQKITCPRHPDRSAAARPKKRDAVAAQTRAAAIGDVTRAQPKHFERGRIPSRDCSADDHAGRDRRTVGNRSRLMKLSAFVYDVKLQRKGHVV